MTWPAPHSWERWIDYGLDADPTDPDLTWEETEHAKRIEKLMRTHYGERS